jgi:hypothetical protein
VVKISLVHRGPEELRRSLGCINLEVMMRTVAPFVSPRTVGFFHTYVDLIDPEAYQSKAVN